MNNKILLTLFLMIISLSFGIDVNFSLESKYGKGDQEAYDSQGNTTVVDPNYFYNEHLFDINLSSDKLYFYSQFEYSNPPVLGDPFRGLNNFNIEYNTDKFNLKAGDIYTLYGRGLSINMFQDQVIDYDNRLRGLETNYYINDNINIYGLAGMKELKSRLLPQDRYNNQNLLSEAILGGIETDMLHYLFLYQNMVFDDEVELKSYEHNFSINFVFFETDIYIENSQIEYVNLTDYEEKLYGSKLYGSLYRDILGLGVTYEYKNYLNPSVSESLDEYRNISPLSNAPIVYRESNSILGSRKSHSINWNDEIGHQLDVNKYINEMIMLEFNLSIAYKHKKTSNFSDVIEIVKFSESSYERNPFRQLRLSSSGWFLKNKLYYKIGFNNFNETKKDGVYKHVEAFTLPSLFTYSFGKNSITMYGETQKVVETSISIGGEYDGEIFGMDKMQNGYISLTFSYDGKISYSYFFEDESKTLSWPILGSNEIKNYNNWSGSDITYNINNTTQLSLFYGSQKGGLVCANGVCAVQPGFADGMKVTLRSLF